MEEGAASPFVHSCQGAFLTWADLQGPLDLTYNLGREQAEKPELSLSMNLAVTELITATTLGIY